jgi:hypothetical protein
MKIVPRDESRKLTAEQIVGRKVAIAASYSRGQFGGKVGVVISASTEREAVDVAWEGLGNYSHAWGRNRGLWQIDLIEEAAYAAPRELSTHELEMRLFFGAPATDLHPFLRMRDARTKK